MTTIAIVFLVLSVLIGWGGLVASIIFLRNRPDLGSYPVGGEDGDREDDAPLIRDT